MLTSLQKTWGGLTLVQRIALIGVLTAVLGGFLLLTITVSRPKYTVLKSNLAPEDAAAIAAKLHEDKVDFRLSDNNRTIEVPANKRDEIALEIAANPLPSGASPGLGLFDKADFAQTEQSQRVKFQRAIQDELMNTCRGIEGVVNAEVLLATPPKPLFTEKADLVTASVKLTLRPGFRLQSRQVTGIANMIAASVERLQPENVVIIDNKGNQLTGVTDPNEASSSQAQQQERYEQRLKEDLQRLADRVLGPDKSAISVRVELDFDQTETTSEVHKASGADGRTSLPLEEQTTSEVFTRTAGGATPGVLGNAGNANRTVPGVYNNSKNDRRFAPNKTVEKRVIAPGRPRSISVGAFIDTKIDAATQASLKKTLAAAAGIDPKRGDQIEITVIPFDQSVAQTAAREVEAAQKSERNAEMMRNGAALLITLVVAGFTFLMLRRPRRAPRTVRSDATIADAPETPAIAAGVAGALPALEASAEEIAYDAPEEALATPMGRLNGLAEEHPEEIARLLRSWIRPATS